jgi:hypothetical protein
MTRSAPLALTLITLSKTVMSVAIGVAISPPNPPQFTTPQRSTPSRALRMLSSEVKSNGSVRHPVVAARLSSALTLRPLATTSAPAATS